MGLIVVKAIKPAAGPDEMFESLYVLTPVPIAVDNGGVKYFVSYDTTAVASMSIGVQTGSFSQYFFSHGEANAVSMAIGVQAGSFAQYLSNHNEAGGTIPLTLGGNVP